MKKTVKTIGIALSVLMATGLFACKGGKENADLPAKHRDADNSVVKKGVCVSRYNEDDSTFAQKIDDLDVGWYYTWGAQTNNSHIKSDIEYVPMVHNRGYMNDATLGDIKQKYEDGTYKYLLTFNEPDLPDQANMSVDEAIGYWEKLEGIGIPLSSPAVSYYSAENGNEWLDTFMAKATDRGLRVDFIAIHIYQSFYSTGAVNELKATLDALYDKYKLPVWLTEFGAIDIISRDAQKPNLPSGTPGRVSASCTAKNAQSYITQATNMLEQCGYVERYSWFVDNFAGMYGEDRANYLWEAPYTSLYNDDDTIAEVGKTYKGISSNAPLYLLTTDLASGKVGAAYSAAISVAGGTGDYTVTASGLPSGLTIAKNGTISGKPKNGGSFAVRITATDSGKTGRRQTLTRTYALQIK